MARDNPNPEAQGVHRSATTDGVTVSPSLDAVIQATQVPGRAHSPIGRRTLRLCILAILLGLAGGVVAHWLMSLIGLVTNLAFYGRLSIDSVAPALAVSRLGAWVIPIPVAGALLVGLMARYGSKPIRGHGIPEAMEQVLTNRSPRGVSWASGVRRPRKRNADERTLRVRGCTAVAVPDRPGLWRPRRTTRRDRMPGSSVLARAFGPIGATGCTPPAAWKGSCSRSKTVGGTWRGRRHMTDEPPGSTERRAR